jgi:hypothetical protein
VEWLATGADKLELFRAQPLPEPLAVLGKGNSNQPSGLCFADKLAFALTPRWPYLPCVWATGELPNTWKRKYGWLLLLIPYDPSR